MNKKMITLTEQDIHNLVKESLVRTLMNEGYTREQIEEAWYGGLKSTVDRATNAVKNGIENTKEKFAEYPQKLNDKVNKVKNGAKNFVKGVKKTYQAGSIQQDVQQYIKAAQTALTNLQKANQRSVEAGFRQILDKNTSQAIQQCLNSFRRINGVAQSINTTMKNTPLTGVEYAQ